MNKFIQFMEEKFIPVANKISRQYEMTRRKQKSNSP